MQYSINSINYTFCSIFLASSKLCYNRNICYLCKVFFTKQRPPAMLVVGGKILPWRCSKKQRPPAVLVVGEKVLPWRCSKKQRPPAVLVVGNLKNKDHTSCAGGWGKVLPYHEEEPRSAWGAAAKHSSYSKQLGC